MFKIGIRAHDLDNVPFDNVDDLIFELKKQNIKYLQLVPVKAFRSLKLDDEFMKKLSLKLKDNDIEVAMIGAYFNMVHKENKKVLDGIDNFKRMLNYSILFKTKYVGSETGSLNGDKWTFNIENLNDDTYNKAKSVIEELQNYSNNTYAKPIIEGAYQHTMYSVDRLYQVVNELNLPFVTFDLFNFLYIGNYDKQKEIFDKGIELFKDKIKIFHIKDFVVENGSLKQVAIGDGLMLYDYYLKVIKEKYPDSFLILEGVTKDNIKKSVEFLRKHEY